jgi:glyoxylate reductase
VPGRIVVTRRIPEPALDLLHASDGDVWVSPHDRPLTAEELHAAVAGADAVLTLLHDRVDDAFLDAAGPGLRVVANVAVGYDNVDVAACARRGVAATNTPGVLTDATADLAFALILMATRRLGEGERLVRAGTRWSWSMFFLLGMGLQDKLLGIVGLGQIGTATARRARAFGMRIAYTGRRRAAPELEAELDATFVESLDELVARADVVSLHCPLTSATHHLIDAPRLARMRPSAYLVNTTRGPVVDEAALADALRDGVIAGAGLDVFEREPEVHPGLLELENVILIPHLGSATVETRTAMGVLAARNALAVLAGEAPLTPITP